jgi:hypothetical protein
VPKNEWPQDSETLEEIGKLWQEPFGDKRQELVFIGQSLNKDKIIKQLNDCLLTAQEQTLSPDEWANQQDPFIDMIEASGLRD